MGDAINIILDNLQAVLQRMISLPVVFLMLLLVLGLAVLWAVLQLISKKFGWQKKTTNLIPALGLAALLLLVGLVIDKKLSAISTGIEAVDYKMFSLINEVGTINFNLKTAQNKLGLNTDSTYKSGLYDLKNLQKNIETPYLISQQSLSPAADLLVLRSFKPLASVFVAVINLDKAKVVLTPQIAEKWMTSDFAKKYNCDIAINGEAGRTPMQGCGFGEWIGSYVVNGNVILKKDSEKRPSLGFSATSQATYYPEKTIDTTASEKNYNLIWGRFDVLVNGVVKQDEEQKNYPRTVMGIDSVGRKLYLLVADGRQPQYSLGISYAEAAKILLYLGAKNAMACDQGGSSCMYIKKLGGIVSRPADGEERFVYTHFGIQF